MSLFFSSLIFLCIGILRIKYQKKKRVYIEDSELINNYRNSNLIDELNINNPNSDSKWLLSDCERDYDEDEYWWLFKLVFIL